MCCLRCCAARKKSQTPLPGQAQWQCFSHPVERHIRCEMHPLISIFMFCVRCFVFWFLVFFLQHAFRAWSVKVVLRTFRILYLSKPRPYQKQCGCVFVSRCPPVHYDCIIFQAAELQSATRKKPQTPLPGQTLWWMRLKAI